MTRALRLLGELKRDDLAGKKVLLRLDLNLPLEQGQIIDDFRLQRSLDTITFLRAAEARILLLSHLSDQRASLQSVAGYLGKFFPVSFVSALEQITNEPLVLLENLRRYSGEEANDPQFVDRLAALGDLFVNDAFAASHRKHASIVGLPRRLPAYAGFLLAEEVANLSRLFAPEPPLIIVLGGAKFGTKLPLIKKFLPLAERIFVGGALAHPFFKARGYEIGRSRLEAEIEPDQELLASPKIILPGEVIVQNGMVKKIEQVSQEDSIVDLGPASSGYLAGFLQTAKTILWNGPLGNYEAGFISGTAETARVIAAGPAFSVVGGGDTIAAIKALGLLERFGFVSTGGGAMLEFLANGTLPGLEALGVEKVLTSN